MRLTVSIFLRSMSGSSAPMAMTVAPRATVAVLIVMASGAPPEPLSLSCGALLGTTVVLVALGAVGVSSSPPGARRTPMMTISTMAPAAAGTTSRFRPEVVPVLIDLHLCRWFAVDVRGEPRARRHRGCSRGNVRFVRDAGSREAFRARTPRCPGAGLAAILLGRRRGAPPRVRAVAAARHGPVGGRSPDHRP